jgi:hypothetical protein
LPTALIAQTDPVQNVNLCQLFAWFAMNAAMDSLRLAKFARMEVMLSMWQNISVSLILARVVGVDVAIDVYKFIAVIKCLLWV